MSIFVSVATIILSSCVLMADVMQLLVVCGAGTMFPTFLI